VGLSPGGLRNCVGIVGSPDGRSWSFPAAGGRRRSSPACERKVPLHRSRGYNRGILEYLIMLPLYGAGSRLCDGVTRREMLRLGGLGALGLALPQLLQARQAPTAAARRAGGFGQARSCIVLFLMGGPPQHSTWDPKPDAPANVRGAFGPIATRVPGIRVCELMPRLAHWTDRLAILRAVSTGDNAHSSSGYYMMTGRPHQPVNF